MRNLITALVMLTACTTYKPFEPTTVRAPDDAFNKATRVLVQRGESIETKDEGAGIIVTAWKDETSMGTNRRLRWTITVQNAAVTVTSQCEAKISGDPAPGQSNGWEDCGSQPGDRTAQGQAIANEIGR
jgi:hypothetical protein